MTGRTLDLRLAMLVSLACTAVSIGVGLVLADALYPLPAVGESGLHREGDREKLLEQRQEREKARDARGSCIAWCMRLGFVLGALLHGTVVSRRRRELRALSPEKAADLLRVELLGFARQMGQRVVLAPGAAGHALRGVLANVEGQAGGPDAARAEPASPRPAARRWQPDLSLWTFLLCTAAGAGLGMAVARTYPLPDVDPGLVLKGDDGIAKFEQQRQQRQKAEGTRSAWVVGGGVAGMALGLVLPAVVRLRQRRRALLEMTPEQGTEALRQGFGQLVVLAREQLDMTPEAVAAVLRSVLAEVGGEAAGP